MKKFFKKFHSLIKNIMFLAIIGVSFYSGMYVVSSTYGHNEKEMIKTSIEKVFNSTKAQPIILIVPDRSLMEKTKMLVGIEVPEREVIEISTSASTRILFQDEIGPGFFKTALTATGNGIEWTWNKTKQGAEWTWDKIKFWDKSKDKNKAMWSWIKGLVN